MRGQDLRAHDFPRFVSAATLLHYAFLFSSFFFLAAGHKNCWNKDIHPPYFFHIYCDIDTAGGETAAVLYFGSIECQFLWDCIERRRKPVGV